MYFTSDIENPWGDDWDDRPYEHNAGTPYETQTTVTTIKFRGHYTMPCDFYLNSPYSVQDINNGAVPWAYTDEIGGLFGGDSMDKAIKWLMDNKFEWEYVR